MKYVYHKGLHKQVQELRKAGGKYQKAAWQIVEILDLIRSEVPNPFQGFKQTNHGESRIKNCIKYDLSGYARLITVKNEKICILIFAGKHEECDRWLDNNRGHRFTYDERSQELRTVYISEDLTDPTQRIAGRSDYSEGILIEKIPSRYYDKMADGCARSVLRKIERYDATVDENELLTTCMELDAGEKQELFFDVLMKLRESKVEEAKNRVHQYLNDHVLVDSLITDQILTDLKSNDEYINLESFDDSTIRMLMSKVNWHDWMLFMHPQQREVVERDYKGTARLLGVSGSGKTCVMVKRAVRLARKYAGEKILILTLNQALASLIRKLINVACEGELPALKEQIEVKSFWELCKELLIRFEPHNIQLYDDYSHKHLEDVESIWKEYYLCENYNDDARVMWDVHKSLLARGIYPEEYLKQEFDWIRSAFDIKDRKSYLSEERQGRSVPLDDRFRRKILEGLQGWEEKMQAIGVIDYLGLLKPLIRYESWLEPMYRSILVDEIQDFGTVELRLVRKLVAKGENDLFLCGDIAQQVHTKQHKIQQASIRIGNYLTIRKNYRNSREILEAAYEVFHDNVPDDEFQYEGFEILNPEYANFSSPKPFLIEADNLDEEFSSAKKYLEENLEPGEKGCIAICGYNFYDIKRIGGENEIRVLDGNINLDDGNLFLSDMEQTKGFEFDRMVIVNCNNEVLPNSSLPREEWYRDIAKLYVAMTRAKKELFISYSFSRSNLFDSCLKYFTLVGWSDHVEPEDLKKISLPTPSKVKEEITQIESLTGEEFLYTRKTIGTSLELQTKLEELIRGNTVRDAQGRPEEWRNMGELIQEIRRGRNKPVLNRKFGPKVYTEISRLFALEKS